MSLRGKSSAYTQVRDSIGDDGSSMSSSSVLAEPAEEEETDHEHVHLTKQLSTWYQVSEEESHGTRESSRKKLGNAMSKVRLGNSFARKSFDERSQSALKDARMSGLRDVEVLKKARLKSSDKGAPAGKFLKMHCDDNDQRTRHGITHWKLDSRVPGTQPRGLVVCAHGLGTCLHDFDYLVVVLQSQGYNVVRWDYYGHGWSQLDETVGEEPMGETMYEMQAREVLAAVGQELKMEQGAAPGAQDSGFMVDSPLRDVPPVALWIGWDVGALIGLHVSDASPGLISRMVLLSPPIGISNRSGGCFGRGKSSAAHVGERFNTPSCGCFRRANSKAANSKVEDNFKSRFLDKSSTMSKNTVATVGALLDTYPQYLEAMKATHSNYVTRTALEISERFISPDFPHVRTLVLRSGKERWQGWSPEDESLLQDTYRGTDGESLFTFKTLQGVGGLVLLERPDLVSTTLGDWLAMEETVKGMPIKGMAVPEETRSAFPHEHGSMAGSIWAQTGTQLFDIPLDAVPVAVEAVELSPRHSASARPAFRRQEGFGGKKGKDDKSKNAASRKAKEKVEQKRRKIAERPQHPLDIPRVCYRAPGDSEEKPESARLSFRALARHVRSGELTSEVLVFQPSRFNETVALGDLVDLDDAEDMDEADVDEMAEVMMASVFHEPAWDML